MQALDQTLTFLYTDIEGSTKIWERQPDEMRRAIERHDTILHDTIAANQGRVFRTSGDAVSASFAAADHAVKAAREAQAALYAEPWPTGSPLRVRIVLHTGQAEEQNGDYVGASLNHIGRLLPACHGGQVLLTLVTTELVGDRLPPGTSLVDLGAHRFRDLTSPEHVFQLNIDGLPERFPPIKSLDFYPNNLPVQLTSFIGRERELEEVKRLLSDSRLVTLTGPGGTGKTRVSLQAAAEMQDRFPDGVWLVELAPISNPALIVHSIATALSLREQSQRPLKESLIDALRPQRLLLILDNCEHLIEACAAISEELLRNCPDVKLLTSSRELLGVPGEVVYRVPSLSLPVDHGQLSLAQIEQSEAVRLFLDRVNARQRSFQLTSENAEAVAKICTRLDGIPLAIELAAARVGVFTPEQIAERLDDRFRLLTGGSRTALPRQQTLEALFDWSYDLLAQDEQALLRCLSVFTGGWTIEAAEAICAYPASQISPDAYAADLLEQLVNKSLIIADINGESVRYRMLETTRQYAQKKLMEAGQAYELRRLHMQYFRKMVDQRKHNLFSVVLARYETWQKTLDPEIDNLRAASGWALENDLSAAIAFATSLSVYWGVRGVAGEIRHYLRAVLRRLEASPEYQGELSLEQRKSLTDLYVSENLLSIYLGQNQAALESGHQAVKYARQTDDPSRMMSSLSILGEAAGLVGDHELAMSANGEAIALARQSGDKMALGITLFNIALFTMIPLGDFEGSIPYAQEGVRILSQASDPWGAALAAMFWAAYEMEGGNLDEAGRYLQKAYDFFSANNDIYFGNLTRSSLAELDRRKGNYPKAIEGYRESAQTWKVIGNLGAAARCLECIAFIQHDQAEDLPPEQRQALLEQAAGLLGLAEAIREQYQSPMRPDERVEYEGYVERLKDRLGVGFQPAWDHGRRKRLDEALRSLTPQEASAATVHQDPPKALRAGVQ